MAIEAVKIDGLSGLTIKDYREVRTALANSYRAILGSGLDLSASSPDGQVVDLFSLAYQELAEALQKVVANMDEDSAEGVFLSSLAKLKGGLTRIEGESDESLRKRMKKVGLEGICTIDGMQTYLSRFMGQAAIVTQNLDEHFVQVFVNNFTVEQIPEDDSDWYKLQNDSKREATLENWIAQKIWNCRAGGTKLVGEKSGIARSVRGRYFVVNYSTFRHVDYEVLVLIKRFDEETLPSDYNEKIRDSVIEWSKGEYIPGKDIVPKRMYGPVFSSVSGIEDVVVKVADVETGDYTEERVTVPDDVIVNISSVEVVVVR